ncbi:MAG: DUF1810 domain-containing protein [Muribaculaceae bacterium]|nr:DUF1810 domain-containing protein [Muribaculaceae bacterium]
MTYNNYNLERFLQAQEDVYPVALQELQEGRKRSHWMWYVFPQLKQLGRSYNAKFYGISGVEEARAYLDMPVLGERLKEVAATILRLPTDNAVEVFGGIDSLKLKSSMTLFDYVCPNDVFAKVLDKYFGGRRDQLSIKLIGQESQGCLAVITTL